MEVVFFGTPDYVLPILSSLDKAFGGKNSKSPVVAVVTQKPKPKDREKFLSYTPVDSWAHKHNIPVFYDSMMLKSNNIKADVGVAASYGSIISNEIIKYFPRGILVVHPSVLPSFRWGSPIPATLITGVNPTGVTIIKMDEKFDHGPIVSQYKEEVLPEDTTGSLLIRLFASSAPVLVELLLPYIANKITLRPQDDSQASYARMITKDDAFIPPAFIKFALSGKEINDNWEIPFIKTRSEKGSLVTFSFKPNAGNLDRFIRAMDPWPVAWSYVQLTANSIQPRAKRIKFLKAHLEKLVTSTYCLVPDLVQLESKSQVAWKQFCEAYPNYDFK
jgi:methionyl-tRNA formyltransferase